jgi:hypothetical protein
VVVVVLGIVVGAAAAAGVAVGVVACATDGWLVEEAFWTLEGLLMVTAVVVEVVAALRIVLAATPRSRPVEL